MDFTWRDCAVGGADGKGYMDFGAIGAVESTSDVLETYRVQEVSFAVAVLNLDAQATFILEGKIGDYWFSLPATQILIAPTGDPAVNRATGVLTYGHCASISAIRCRFIMVDAGALVPSAIVLAQGVRVTH